MSPVGSNYRQQDTGRSLSRPLTSLVLLCSTFTWAAKPGCLIGHICFQTGEMKHKKELVFDLPMQSSWSPRLRSLLKVHFILCLTVWGVEPDVTKSKEGSNVKVGQVLDRGRALSMAFSLALNAKQAISHCSKV